MSKKTAAKTTTECCSAALTNGEINPIASERETENDVPAGAMQRDKDNMLRRLRRIEGQVRGLQRMVDEDKYCVDILVQVAAVRAALNKVGLMLLEDHTRGCVTDAIANNEADEAIDELLGVINRFVR